METHDMATEAMAKTRKSFIMTANEQALLAQMQDLGYSHGLCITALQSYPKTSWLSATCLPLSMTNNPQKRTLSRKWQECVKPIVGTPSVKVRI
jgi:hypothetical protein